MKLLRTIQRTIRELSSEAGAALIEFALVAPILLILIVGIFEFGDAFRRYLVITDTAREGARYAVVTPQVDSADVVSRIDTRLKDSGIAANTITVTGLRDGSGQTATVYIEYDHRLGAISTLMPESASTMRLRSSFSMRIE